MKAFKLTKVNRVLLNFITTFEHMKFIFSTIMKSARFCSMHHVNTTYRKRLLHVPKTAANIYKS